MLKRYEIIEDNGGGLTLVVFDKNDKVEYIHTGYEYNIGQLTEDLKALEEGQNPLDWEGNSENPQADYDNITSFEYGHEIVADNDGVYCNKMGKAASIEFKNKYNEWINE